MMKHGQGAAPGALALLMRSMAACCLALAVWTTGRAADAIANQPSLLLEFNDHAWNEPCNTATRFANTGQVGPSILIPDIKNVSMPTTEDFAGTTFAWNTTGGTALRMSQTAHPDTRIIGSTMTWGRHIVMETRVRRTTGTFSGLYLVCDNTSGTSLRWYVNASQRMVLEVNKGNAAGQIVVTGTDAVFPDAQWVRLGVVLDLTATSIGNAVRFYRNGTQLTTVTSGTYTGTMASGTGSIAPCGIELLDRMSAFDLMCDFIRITPDASADLVPTATWYVGEVSSDIQAGASVAILVHPQLAMRKIANRPEDVVGTSGALRDGVTPRYVGTDATGGIMPFHGVYEINFGLDVTRFIGNMTVDIALCKPGESVYKKIGEVSCPLSGAQGTLMNIHYYWNSRVVQYEWTDADTQPYSTEDSVRLRFRAR